MVPTMKFGPTCLAITMILRLNKFLIFLKLALPRNQPNHRARFARLGPFRHIYTHSFPLWQLLFLLIIQDLHTKPPLKALLIPINGLPHHPSPLRTPLSPTSFTYRSASGPTSMHQAAASPL